MSCQRVEHQHGSGPLPGFPRASASTGIVHRLSGPTAATARFRAAPALAFASPPRRAPWSVFQYGAEASASSVLSLFTGACRVFAVRSRYLFAIGLRVYLALDASTTRSRCTTKQRYSSLARAPGLSPALAPLSSGSRRMRHNAEAYQWGCSLFARRYYGNPRLFLLLSLLICLSPGRRRALRARFGPRPLPAAFRVRTRPSSPAEPMDPVQRLSRFVLGVGPRQAGAPELRTAARGAAAARRRAKSPLTAAVML